MIAVSFETATWENRGRPRSYWLEPMVDGTKNSAPRLWFSLLLVLLAIELAGLVALVFHVLLLLLTPSPSLLRIVAATSAWCSVASAGSSSLLVRWKNISKPRKQP